LIANWIAIIGAVPTLIATEIRQVNRGKKTVLFLPHGG
jgi:hypothetical protein